MTAPAPAWKVWGALWIVYLVWGSTYLAIRVMVETVPPLLGAGVRFLVAAEAKQIAQGWGAKISVKAESLDGKEHVLLSPKNGPIAFAAAVFKKGSTEAERIPDGREGEGELKIGAGSAANFSREFPNKGGRVLAMGETLDMEVALWGLGDTAADRRPVKQFVHVKMKVEKGKPKAVIEPPASAK